MKNLVFKLTDVWISKILVPYNLRLSQIKIPKYVTEIKDKLILKKIMDLNNWYKRTIGADKLKLYQDRVATIEERLLAARERRKEISTNFAEIRKKSIELQDQLHKFQRQEDLQKFLDLIKEETVVLMQELDVAEKFATCDREEHEIFTAFTNATRDSHQKQQTQLRYLKYFAIILTITGSSLAFVYSSLKSDDMKMYLEEHLDRITAEVNDIHSLPKGTTINIDHNIDGKKILWIAAVSLVGLLVIRTFT